MGLCNEIMCPVAGGGYIHCNAYKGHDGPHSHTFPAQTVNELSQFKFRIGQDYCLDWYAVPENRWAEFQKWLNCSQEEYDSWAGFDFEKQKLGHDITGYTFTGFGKARD